MEAKTRVREAPEVRRARILDQAIALIGERGYYGFTIQELGKRSGLSNPGLLHYFPSKLDVMLAALREIEAREAEFMEPLVLLAERELIGRDSATGVLNVLRAMVARATARPEMIRFFVELQAESLDPAHPGHEWWQQRETKTLSFLTRLLTPHVADATGVARHVLAQMDGLSLQWLRAFPALNAIDEWDRALARLLPELHHPT